MSNKQDLLSMSLLDNLNTSGAGYDVLRYISLPELLGPESQSLLYFMGKNLARKFEITALGDIVFLFEKLGWGKLELVKEKRKELQFNLLSDAVVQRLEAPIDAEFRLEAGFLAEAIQLLKGHECECIEDINYKIHQIQFRALFTS